MARTPRSKTLLAIGTALAAIAALVAPMTGTASAAPAPGPLVWSDEFDGPAGSAVDSSKWRFDIGGGGWGNNEHQYYTDSTRNAAKDGNGNLVITARRENPANYQCHYGTCQYTSARLLTAATFTRTYGRFEARMKLPRGQGIWPAFWMLGGTSGWPDNGEIDIMENIGREPNTVHGTIHGPGYSGGRRHRRRLHDRRPVRRRLPHLRRRLVAEPHRLVRGRRRIPAPHPRRPGRQPLGLRPPVLHDHERGGRRQLARLPRRQHHVPADPDRGLRPRLRPADHGRRRPDHRHRRQVRRRGRRRHRQRHPPSSSGTATAPAPRAGAGTATARSARSASAWT
ncbi:hypothetical protein GCM10020001_002560 [Nonomuraea salmonea]